MTDAVVIAVVVVIVQTLLQWLLDKMATLAPKLIKNSAIILSRPEVFDFVLQTMAFIGVIYIFYTLPHIKEPITADSVRAIVLLGIMLVVSYMEFRRAARRLLFKEK